MRAHPESKVRNVGLPTDGEVPHSGTTPSWLWTYDKVGNRLVDQKADTSGVAASLSSYNATNQLTSRAAGGSIAVAGSTSEVASVSVNAQPAPTTGANTFQGKATVSGSSPQQFTVQATDPSGNVRTSTYSVNVSSPGGATFTYDENGNTTQKVEGGDTWVYVWDAENRLVEVKKNGSTQATFRYVSDNEDWIRRTGGTQVDIVHGPGIDEPLAQDSGGVVTYFHADALGSVQKHTSAAGAVVQTIEYDAWGNALSGAPGPYGFTSREPDLETGLQYYRARYYDARAGRFLSEDPIDTVDSRFTYVSASPVRFQDPLGLLKLDFQTTYVPLPGQTPGGGCGWTKTEKLRIDGDCREDPNCPGKFRAEFTFKARWKVLYYGQGGKAHEDLHIARTKLQIMIALSYVVPFEKSYATKEQCWAGVREGKKQFAKHFTPDKDNVTFLEEFFHTCG